MCDDSKIYVFVKILPRIIEQPMYRFDDLVRLVADFVICDSKERLTQLCVVNHLSKSVGH